MDQKVSHVFGVPCEDETDKVIIWSINYAWLEYGSGRRNMVIVADMGMKVLPPIKILSNHCPRVRRDTKWEISG